MKSNMVPMDAAIRSGVGMLLLTSPLIGFDTYPYNLAGIVLLVTGVFSYCPLYSAFHAVFGSHGAGVSKQAQGHA